MFHVSLIGLRDARVVDEHVEPAEPRHRALDRALRARERGDVADHELRVGAGRGHAPARLFAALLVEVGDDDPGAFLGESLRRGAAESRAAARHDRDPSLESHAVHLQRGLCGRSRTDSFE